MPPGSRQLRHNLSDRYYGKWQRAGKPSLPLLCMARLSGPFVRRSKKFLTADPPMRGYGATGYADEADEGFDGEWVNRRYLNSM
jgi:hypothetical protein